MLRAANRPPLHEQPIADARAGMTAFSQQMATPRMELHRVEDRRVSTPAGTLGVRVYWPRPASAGERLPLVIYFHGGGFVLGDVDTHDAIARYFCRHSDAIVINVDYRRAPEHKFPAAVDDSFAATRWAVAHAEELGGEPSRVAVAGDSAGGNLAAVVCQLAKVAGSPAIAFQALLYPVVDLDLTAAFPSRREFGGGDYFLSNRDMGWFNTQYLADPDQVRDPRASPLRGEDLRGLPPALIITAGCDPLRDEGKAYADRLAAAGVAVEQRCFEQTIHAFVSFASALPAGQEALSFVAARMRAALHPPA